MKSNSQRKAEGFPGERLTVLSTDIVRHMRTLPLCKGVCVTHLGRFDRVQGHYVTRSKGAPETVIIVCLDGAGVVKCKNKNWKLRRGNGIVLPPATPHHYEADPADPWSICWFHFVGRNAKDCVDALGSPVEHSRFWVQDVDSLIESFEDCYRYVLAGFTDSDLIGLTTSFLRFIGLCRTLQRSRSSRRHHGEEMIIQSIRFMRTNVNRRVELAELARTTGLSVPHYSMIFKRHTRCGPMQFFNRLKMQRASEQLVTTDLDVAEIGYALGFSDPFYFSRSFRRLFAMSPTQYRLNASMT